MHKVSHDTPVPPGSSTSFRGPWSTDRRAFPVGHPVDPRTLVHWPYGWLCVITLAQTEAHFLEEREVTVLEPIDLVVLEVDDTDPIPSCEGLGPMFLSPIEHYTFVVTYLQLVGRHGPEVTSCVIAERHHD